MKKILNCSLILIFLSCYHQAALAQCTITLSQPAQLSAAINGTTAICNGTSAQISVAVSGGTAPWTVTCNSVDYSGSTSPITFTVSPTTTTTYQGGTNVSVTDALDCSSDYTAAATVTVNQLPSFSATYTDITCFNEGDGTITLTASGGLGPYMYAINDGGGWSAWQTGNQFTGLDPGTYSVKIKDANGCEQINATAVNQILQCGAGLTVDYGGKTYHTVKIGNQCWLKENLDIGVMVSDNYTGANHDHATNNGIIEKYCYFNSSALCDAYGGLYSWNEMMQYSTTPGSQGICPSSWHVPTDVEWCTLTTTLDNTVNCNVLDWSGTDIADKLKESGTAHWAVTNTGTNESLFTALGAGYREWTGNSKEISAYGVFWTSNQANATEGIDRYLVFNWHSIFRSGAGNHHKNFGFSVRCIKNE